MQPNFDHEIQLWQQGHTYVAGVDEVGRGAWAGPLVACAVVFHPSITEDAELMSELENLRDSKKLSPQKRHAFIHLFEAISKPDGFSFALGQTNPGTIDKHGVTSATGRAMRQALRNLNHNLASRFHAQLPPAIDHALIDAFPIRYLPKRDHTPIIKGDKKSITIAAASIIAKEYRDALMRRYAKHSSLSVYGWETNVGYGTKEHQTAIRQHGTTRLHRKLFIPDRLLD